MWNLYCIPAIETLFKSFFSISKQFCILLQYEFPQTTGSLSEFWRLLQNLATQEDWNKKKRNKIWVNNCPWRLKESSQGAWCSWNLVHAWGANEPKSGQSQLDLVTSTRSSMSVQNCASLNQRAWATLRGIPQGSRSALRLGKHQTYREKNHPPLLEIEEKKEANLIA